MKKLVLIAGIMFCATTIFAQNFEEAKLDPASFQKVKATLGADFAMQYQAIDNTADDLELMPLGSGLNLPTANMVITGDLAPGMKVVLETYLSSRHHNEAWVKGGYLLMDQLPFLNSEKVDKLMQNLTFKVGVMEVNYGDGHFRRSDNGNVIKNPFVGNYVMDAFTTAPAIEVMYRKDGWLGMFATGAGNLKPELVGYNSTDESFITYEMAEELAFYGKFGFDKQLNNDLRLRIMVSPYMQAKHHRGTLYSGDRAGGRYYSIMVPASQGKAGTDIKANSSNGRWGPGATYKLNSVMLNLFAKYKSLEVFGIYENAKGTNVKDGPEFNFNQLSLEALVRFGGNDQFYAGGRYNTVKNQDDLSVNRVQIGGGWYLTKNVVTKVEYVDQKYNDFTNYGKEAGFNGMMVEAAISF